MLSQSPRPTGWAGQPALIGLLVMAITGCSRPDKWASKRPPVHRAGGVVVWQGKPADGATVTFLPREGKHSAVGRTDKDGRFRLGTFAYADGAVAGDYAVKVERVDQVGVDAKGDPIGRSIYPEQFSNAAATPLAASVTKSGPNEFTFDLSVVPAGSGVGK